MISISIDLSEVKEALGEAIKQLPYAVATGINNTLVNAQTGVINTISHEFTVRRSQFVKQSVKIGFAKKDNLVGTLGIVSMPGSRDTSDILSKFEEGGDKSSKSGGKVAIPATYARPNTASVVSAAKRPRALTKAFKIVAASGKQLLMVRVARKGRFQGVNVAYVLENSVPIRPRLNFYDTALGIIEGQLESNMQKAVDKALATAK